MLTLTLALWSIDLKRVGLSGLSGRMDVEALALYIDNYML